jgi:AAA+ superfamily predicted ATPase
MRFYEIEMKLEDSTRIQDGDGSEVGRSAYEATHELFDKTEHNLLISYIGYRYDREHGSNIFRFAAVEKTEGLLREHINGYMKQAFPFTPIEVLGGPGFVGATPYYNLFGDASVAALQSASQNAPWHVSYSTPDRLQRFFEHNSGEVGRLLDLMEVPVLKASQVVLRRYAVRDDRCSRDMDMDTAIAKMKKCNCANSAVDELKHIYESRDGVKAHGNPVHYVVCSDDRSDGSKTVKTLVDALHASGRIYNNWFRTLEFTENSRWEDESIDDCFKLCSGGAIAVKINFPDTNTVGSLTSNAIILSGICELMRKYQHEVISIICLGTNSEKMKMDCYERLGDMRFVELSQRELSGKNARAYLRQKAKNNGIAPTRALYKVISDNDTVYPVTKLDAAFNSWHSKQLVTRVYPQYKGLVSADKVVCKSMARGSAYRELEEMIGLERAKETVAQALDFHKAQRAFKGRDFCQDALSRHMVFYGNPGTAKTTFARLFTQIMLDNKLISGGLVECGRADIVSKYLGGTAPQVREKFKEAKGGVLFIDEAYSLAESREGLYGDEAINTLVQEMENHRDDVTVILAGYPQKMEELLQKNPGLRSRIGFHVRFDDYSPEELLQITELMARNKGYNLAADVAGKLMPIYREAVRTVDFGNGRFVRNMLEQAMMRQAGRLVHGNLDKISDGDLKLLRASDFEAPEVLGQARRLVGFALAA